MDSTDIKEPLDIEGIHDLIKQYYELDKRINDMDKYMDTFIRNINISNEHYRMVQTQYFAMLAYDQVLRMRIEGLGYEV